MKEPTPELVQAFYAHMTERFRANVRSKASAWEMRVAASALEVLGHFMRVPSPESFDTRFVTTIGSTIYVPFDVGSTVWDLWQQMVVLVHECEHVDQKRRRFMGAHEIDYLTSGALRAHIEAEAYRCNLELHHWRYGDVPADLPRTLAQMLLDYGCTETDADVTETYLRSSAVSVRRGARMSVAAHEAIFWLDKNAQELRSPKTRGEPVS